MKLVLDASMTMAWHIPRCDSEEVRIADKVLQSILRFRALVPPLWYPEVANGVLVAERRGVRTVSESSYFLYDLGTFPIDTDSMPLDQLQPPLLSLARSTLLTTYDATYLELALRTRSTLATFDRKLAEAARAAGVPVFGDTLGS